jgi:hypothetical protein
MGLSILLSALSVSAYRNSRLKKMIYAIITYPLFAIFSLSQFYEEFILEGGNDAQPNFIINIAVHTIPLVILILFFIGIVKKEKYSNSLQQSFVSP